MRRKKYKRYARGIGDGVKELSRMYKKHAPAVKNAAVKTHRALKASAESISESMVPSIPRRRRGYVDLTAKRKPKRVVRGKGGFYLDFTK